MAHDIFSFTHLIDDQFLSDEFISYFCKEITVIRNTFSEALDDLADSKQFDNEASKEVASTLAAMIFKHIRAGERDPTVLKQLAVQDVVLKHCSESL